MDIVEHALLPGLSMPSAPAAPPPEGLLGHHVEERIADLRAYLRGQSLIAALDRVPVEQRRSRHV
jgi:hypothetical protein